MPVDSLRNQRSLNQASADLQRSTERLSSGKRINRASDDAAGLAIASKLFAQSRTLQVASQNIDNGKSFADIGDATLRNISDISTRQAELAAQAANGTLSDEQRVALNYEYQQLGEEAQRIAATSEFNGVSSSVTLQVGSDSSSSSQLSLAAYDSAALTGNIGNILTADAARTALDSANSRISSSATSRGELGSAVSRLDYAKSNVEDRIVQNADALSRIQDANVADEVARRTAASIQQQIGTALQAQTNNLNRQSVLRLLQ